jgi:hypothetical protein
MDLLDELDSYQAKAERQNANIFGIKGKIEKEEAKDKSDQNQEKLEKWYRELRRTEGAFRRTQVLI